MPDVSGTRDKCPGGRACDLGIACLAAATGSWPGRPNPNLRGLGSLIGA